MVAVLGTGLMGDGIARSLLRAGFEVAVWNRTPERAEPLARVGARVAATAAEAVTGADVVLVVVYDAAAVLDVLGQAGAAAPPRAIWVQTATIGHDGVAQVVARAGELGLRLVETMMMGSKAQAAEGRLILIGGGDPAVFDELAPVLAAVAQKVVQAGPLVGDATAVELACNAWVTTVTAGTAQSLALLRAQHVDPRLFLDTIAGATSDSPYAHLKGAQMMAGEYPAQFALGAARKDLELIAAAADRAGTDTTLLDALRGLCAAADRLGHAPDDLASVYTAFLPERGTAPIG